MAKTAACPSCGAPVTFRSVASIMAVCDFCQSTLVRQGANLENLGKMAEFLEDRSVLQRGSEGRWNGRHFGLIGRIQLRYDAGLWNEWHLLFDDMKSGWLSEAGGELVISEPVYVADALPAIADARRHLPDAHLAVAARKSVAPLFTMVAGVDEVITLPGRGGLRALSSWQQDAAVLASGQFDAALLLPNSFATGWIASKSGIAERWGFATDWRARYLSRAVPKPKAPLHQGAYYQALTTALGMAPGPLHARVWPNQDRAKEVLREIGLDLDEPFAVFAPGAAYGRAKQWLPERFAQLAHMLIEKRNWSVVMVGANAEHRQLVVSPALHALPAFASQDIDHVNHAEALPAAVDR